MNSLSKLASGRNILILLFLFLLANFVLIPAVYPAFETLDIKTSYTPEQAYQLISSYGEQGRQHYLIVELTLDVLYPLVSALLFSLAILYTFQRAFPGKPGSQKLALLPFGILVADYAENICVVIMLLRYPQELPLLAQVSNIFTFLKFALTPFELLVFVGLVGWLVQAIRARGKR